LSGKTPCEENQLSMEIMDTQTYWKAWSERCRRDLTTDILPFWMKHGWDRQHGGVYTCVDRDGTLMDSTKSGWFQGRFAFVCSYAYNAVEKKKTWLKAAKSTLDFIDAHLFDARGRAYFSLMDGINAFSGGLAVRGGTLQVTSPLQGVTDVWADGGALTLSALMPNLTNLAVRAAGASVVLEGTATPFPSGVTLSIADGVVTELDFAGVVDVDRLVLGGRPRSPGLYGGIESSAPVKPSSAYFSGTGTLNVLYGPAESGFVLMLR